MIQDKFYIDIAYALQQKRLSLNFDECPWSEEYKQGYNEGWHNAFMFAEQIAEKVLSSYKLDAKADNER